jgi:hypothetical protein
MMLARISSSSFWWAPSKYTAKRLSSISITAAFSTQPLTATTNNDDSSPSHPFNYDAPWLHYYPTHKHPAVMNFINGSFQHPDKAKMKFSCNLECRDPSTNNVLSYIPESASKPDNAATTPSALEQAIAAAKEAFPSWSSTPVQSRQRLLLEYAHLLHKKEVREEIAYWITLEQGKTTADAMGDVWRGLEVVEAATRVGSEMLVSCRS